MISLLHLNKLGFLTIFSVLLIFSSAIAENEAADIWAQNKNQNEQNLNIDNENKITIDSPLLSEDASKITMQIQEQEVENFEQNIIGIYDPEENGFTLHMWSETNGDEIKNILKRINKLKLSKLSENLLFQVLFTNAYPPKKNLNYKDFLKIKINWLIKHKKFKELEDLLKKNPIVGQEPKVIEFLINEYLSAAEIKLACEKINFIDKSVQNEYLDKFTIYCLINNDRKDEALMVLDLLKEKGFKDSFFENKINFLLGLTENANQEVLDNNLLNFYLSHITSNNFNYQPGEKTNEYIWRYLSSANLIKIDSFENEDVVVTYEKAAAENSFDSKEIFEIYKQILFSVNQLMNVEEIYKTLPGYKARALLYQSVILSDNIKRKLYLSFLLKDLFAKDKLLNVYYEELSNILNSIEKDKIPEIYEELVKRNLNKNLMTSQVEFNNDILHKSKVIRHFLENYEKTSRTEKDFKSVYKKIKKNKKYFVSIKDIIVIESLKFDGVDIPYDLDYDNLLEQLTVPSNLEKLVKEKQTGLVMLKIIEIIGEDKAQDLDSETIYFLNRILNELNLKRIRNNILSEALLFKV